MITSISTFCFANEIFDVVTTFKKIDIKIKTTFFKRKVLWKYTHRIVNKSWTLCQSWSIIAVEKGFGYDRCHANTLFIVVLFKFSFQYYPIKCVFHYFIWHNRIDLSPCLPKKCLHCVTKTVWQSMIFVAIFHQLFRCIWKSVWRIY
jgi:hypothetical protein